MMPDIAVGRTILTIVTHFGIPSAYDASRSSSGTRRSISSVDRMTTGKHEQDERQGDSERALLEPEPGDPESEDEQRRHDGRDAGEDVHHERGDSSQPPAAVLDEVDGDQDAEGDGDQRGDERLDEGAVERVIDTATHLLRQDPLLGTAPPGRRGQRLEALGDDVEEDPGERKQREQEGRRHHGCGDDVLRPSTPADLVERAGGRPGVEGGHPFTFPPATARAEALTMNVSTNSTNPAAM